MYDYTFVKRVVLLAREKARDMQMQHHQHIAAVSLRVGALDICCVKHFTEAFKELTDGTALARAELKLEIDPGRVDCHRCGFTDAIQPGQVDCTTSTPAVPCPRCGRVLYVKGGRGITKLELNAEFEHIPAELATY